MVLILIIALIAAIVVIFYFKNDNTKRLKEENSALVDELHKLKMSDKQDDVKTDETEIDKKTIQDDTPDVDHPISEVKKTNNDSVQPPKNNGCIIAVAVVFVSIFIVILYSLIIEDNSKNSSINTEAALDSAAVEQSSVSVADSIEENKVDPENWEYQENIDQMTDKKTYYASCYSTNSVEFEFPYNGGSTMSLVIRKSPKYGHDIYIKIAPGQFVSSASDGCTISVKGDGGKIHRFHCSEPDDYSSDMVFINGYSEFLSLIRKSKTIKIEAPFYKEGNVVFEFNVSGLKWNH